MLLYQFSPLLKNTHRRVLAARDVPCGDGGDHLEGGHDCVDMLLCKQDKGEFRVWWSPLGAMPPFLLFNLLNVLAMWAILKAD